MTCEHDHMPMRRGPGVDAIWDALVACYGREPDFQFGTVRTWEQGGPDPLDSISVYLVDEPVPHWHYIGYGMTELYAKTSGDPQVSGFGYEFTLRLRRDDRDSEPPPFPISVMQNFAREVFGGDEYGVGDYADLHGPILIGADTAIRAITVARDPVLGVIDTSHGTVEFRQLVGTTLDELAGQRRWYGSQFQALLAEHLPMLVTDLDRRSLMANPEFADTVNRGSRLDGSSTGALTTDRIKIRTGSTPLRRTARIHLGALLVPDLIDLLPARLGFDQDLWIISRDDALEITAGHHVPLHRHGDHWAIQLTLEQAHGLAATIRPRAGRYTVPQIPDLQFVVEATTIRTQDGRVERVVG